MQKALLDKMCCPFDKSDLVLTVFNEDQNKEVHEGVMICTLCNRYYPIIYSIPIMSPDEYREFKLELPILKRWGILPDTSQNTFVLEENSHKKLLSNDKVRGA